ncbi:hypothetical protein HPB52_002472 [Rhipicephalus sanguineus]|uniref:Uncharacterized protein n=1 Tax=Rhipicephalus sanguineus TaxID=34632 RepID=A0A9D4PZC9_RHISA|nr:hypothetical protein HPB52_002472 [Rhipicephalus sanguineus]
MPYMSGATWHVVCSTPRASAYSAPYGIGAIWGPVFAATSLTPQDCEPTPRDCDDKVELDPELWNELTETLPVGTAVTYEYYVDSDCAAATSAELTCEEIVSQVREQDCCSSDEDEAGDAESRTTEETISSSDVVVFLEKTRSYLGCCKDLPEDILRKVTDVEAYMHQRLLSTCQKKITDFFKQ